MRLGSERNLFRPFNRILNIDSVLINSSLLRVSNSLSFIKFIARNILYIFEESEKKVEGSFKLPCNFVITRGEVKKQKFKRPRKYYMQPKQKHLYKS